MNQPPDSIIGSALNFDAISVTEKLFGRDVNPGASFGLHILANQNKRDLLQASNDTHMSMSPDEYIPIVEDEGFELALMLPFQSAHCGNDLFNDTLYVYFHPVDAILLSFDTFWSGKSVNGGSFYYNWKPHAENRHERWSVTSSGGWYPPSGRRATPEEWDRASANNELIWSGYHDCREGLRFHIRQLRKFGTFINPWRYSPLLWLTHWGDYHDEKYEALKKTDWEASSQMMDQVTLVRFAKLPEHVRVALSVVPEEINDKPRNKKAEDLTNA